MKTAMVLGPTPEGRGEARPLEQASCSRAWAPGTQGSSLSSPGLSSTQPQAGPCQCPLAQPHKGPGAVSIPEAPQ